jgi:hypothetical protein
VCNCIKIRSDSVLRLSALSHNMFRHYWPSSGVQGMFKQSAFLLMYYTLLDISFKLSYAMHSCLTMCLVYVCWPCCFQFLWWCILLCLVLRVSHVFWSARFKGPNRVGASPLTWGRKPIHFPIRCVQNPISPEYLMSMYSSYLCAPISFTSYVFDGAISVTGFCSLYVIK